MLYVATATPRTIRALAASNGRALWTSALPGTGNISFLGSGPTGIHYRVGSEVVTLKPDTGAVTSRWTLPAGTSVKQYADGRLIGATGSAGASAVLAMNPPTGAVQWRTALTSPVGVTAAGGQVLYLSQRQDQPTHFWGFRALNLNTGSILKSVDLPPEPAPNLDDHEIMHLEVADGGLYLQTRLVSPQGKFDGAKTYKFALPYVAPSLLVLDDPALTYGAGWKVGHNAADYRGADHYTETAQSTATYSFTGTGFRYWFSKAAHHGIVAVSVDGCAEMRIDQYAASRTDGQTSLTSPRLALGTHTIRIRATGDKNSGRHRPGRHRRPARGRPELTKAVPGPGQASMAAASSAYAPSMMNSLRGPTSLPISISNVVSAIRPSSTVIRRSVRCRGLIVVSASWFGVHLTEPLVALRLLEVQTLLGQLRRLSLVLRVGVGVDVLLLALAGVGQLEPVQRRHGGEDPAGIDQRPHVAEEQGGQQAADMGAVGVGVGHEDDLAVAGRLDVEAAAGAGADNLDDRGALGVLQHVADRGLLDVEDLAADRQQGLELGVPGQLGRTECRVALHDEQLGPVDVVAAAVDQLGRQRG